MKLPSKKILYVTYHLPLSNEPGAFRPWMEAKLMRDAGLDVHIITGQRNYLTCDKVVEKSGLFVNDAVEGIPVTRVWMPPNFRKSLFRRLICYGVFSLLVACISVWLLPRKGRLFTATDPIFALPLIELALVLKQGRLFLDERDLYPDTAVALGVLKENGLVTRLMHNYICRLRRKASHLFAATPGIKQYLIAQGIPESKILLLYNMDLYIDEQKMPSLLEQDLANFRLLEANDSLIVMHTGGMSESTDLCTIIKAAKILEDKPNIRFLFFGDGSKKSYYMKFAKRLDLKNIEFYPAIPSKRLRQILRHAHTGLQPLKHGRLFERTLTSKTFDYVAAGLVVIANAKGDTQEFIDKNGLGYCLKPRDHFSLAKQICYLEANRDIISNIQKNNLKWYAQYNDRLGVVKAIELSLA